MKKNIKLRVALLKRDLTYEDLSKISGVSRVYITMAISGRLNLKMAEKQSIAEALDMPVSDLFPVVDGAENE